MEDNESSIAGMMPGAEDEGYLSNSEAFSSDQYDILVCCLDMLVDNFMAPGKIHESAHHPSIEEKRLINGEFYAAFHHISDLVLLAPMILKDIIGKIMSRRIPKRKILIFVECMLGLENYEIGDFPGSTLTTKVVVAVKALKKNSKTAHVVQPDNELLSVELKIEPN